MAPSDSPIRIRFQPSDWVMDQANPEQRGQYTGKSRTKEGPFGRVRDLQRLITFEKLKGTLHGVVYSMEAAPNDFHRSQFKPVLKQFEGPLFRDGDIQARKNDGGPFDLVMPIPGDLQLDACQRRWMNRLTAAYGQGTRKDECSQA